MRRISASLAVLWAVAAAAQQPAPSAQAKVIDEANFYVDGPQLVGETITVSGCVLKLLATPEDATCSGKASFTFGTGALDKEVLRRLIKECDGYIVPAKRCAANVSGKVALRFGKASLQDAQVTWVVP